MLKTSTIVSIITLACGLCFSCVNSACQRNTTAIEFCLYHPAPSRIGQPIHFGSNGKSTTTKSVTFRSTKQAFCRIQIKFSSNTWFDIRPLEGNISDSDYVFSERYTGGQRFTDGCSNNATQVITGDNYAGCQTRESGDIYLYLQTSVDIEFKEAASIHEATNQTENVSMCFENTSVYGNYSLCKLGDFDDGSKVYEGVTRCGVSCKSDCSCVLGDKELVSSCPDDKGPGFATILVYPNTIARLHLGNIGLTELKSDTFKSLSTVKKLFLNTNKLTSLPNGVFSTLGEVHFLNLSLNNIRDLQPDVFVGLRSLKHLTLDDNNITGLSKGVFNGLVSLEKLDLTNNRIVSLQRDVLLPLYTLQVIKLRYNKLSEIMPGAMNGMKSLENIDMAFNDITYLSKGALEGLQGLTWLTLQNNKINGIDAGVFEDTPDLENLWLYGEENTLVTVEHESSFSGLTNNTLVIVHQAATCCFVTEARCETKKLSLRVYVKKSHVSFVCTEHLLTHITEISTSSDRLTGSVQFIHVLAI